MSSVWFREEIEEETGAGADVDLILLWSFE